jgi:hypothetical protein
MFDKYTTVNGIKVKLNAYSEARFKKLQAINQEVLDFITANPDMTINDITNENKEKWWRAKAEILWSSDVPFPEGFFSSEEFELGLLKDSEDSFVVKRLYI